MSLKYALLESHLKTDKKEFTAQVQDVISYDQAAVVKRMASKGTTVTETGILAAFNLLEETLIEITEEGAAVNLNLFRTRPSISGVFENASSDFNKTLHKVNINVSPGLLLRKAAEQIRVQKVDAPATGPHIVEVRDAVSDSINADITPQGGVEILGRDIKIDGTDAGNGVFFIAADGTPNKVNTLVINKPSQLIITAPALTPGDYTLQIKTQYAHSQLYKTPRVTTFQQTLTVV